MILLLILISFTTTKAQRYWLGVTNDSYDSAKNGTWYDGRIFLKDDTDVKGKIMRIFPDARIKFIPENDSISKIYTHKDLLGYYNIYKNDTAFFVVLNTSNNPHHKFYSILRIIEDGDISILVDYWPEIKNIKYPGMMVQYYLWKNHEIYRLTRFKKDLKKIMFDKPSVFEYFNSYKVRNDKEAKVFVRNLVKIYNSL